MTSQNKNMSFQVTVTMVSTLGGRRSFTWLWWEVLGPRICLHLDQISRVIPCGGIHLFTKDDKLSLQVTVSDNLWFGRQCRQCKYSVSFTLCIHTSPAPDDYWISQNQDPEPVMQGSVLTTKLRNTVAEATFVPSRPNRSCATPPPTRHWRTKCIPSRPSYEG